MIITQRSIPRVRERHQRVYDAIRQFKIDHVGRSPTLRELCSLTGITSTSRMVYYLENLESQGAVIVGKSKYQTRHIELPGEQYIPPEPVGIR